MEWYWLLVLLIVHYIADFWVQTHYQSQTKSSNNESLFVHVFTYTICFIPVFWTMAGVTFNRLEEGHAISLVLAALGITFASHFITDYFTSRLSKILFTEKKDIRSGFQVVGLDQMIHYICLYCTSLLLL